MEFAGDFETHLTVQPESSARLEELREWSDLHGLKFLHIVLERGVSPSQPMLTWRGQGVLSAQKAKAEAVARELNAAGFTVARIKIEASPWNQNVPQTPDRAQNRADSCHFEHHIKLLLSAGTDRNALTCLAAEHNAHLSRNALRRLEDGYEERFVTQRVFGEE